MILYKTSQKGIDHIKSFEGLRLRTYLCPAGVLTIGYGHTGKDVKPGMVMIESEACELLAKDLIKYENAVNSSVVVPICQNQFDALVSFAFNCGTGALQRSTLLKLLNKGDYNGAAGQFPNWNKSNKKVLPGLKRRREAEKKMFLGI